FGDRGVEDRLLQFAFDEFFGDAFLQAAGGFGGRVGGILRRHLFPARGGMVGFEFFLRRFDLRFVFVDDDTDVAARRRRELGRLFGLVVGLDFVGVGRFGFGFHLFFDFFFEDRLFDPRVYVFFGEVRGFEEFLVGLFGREVLFFDFPEFFFDL